MQDSHAQEMVIASSRYGISSYVVVPESMDSRRVAEVQRLGLIVKFSTHRSFPGGDLPGNGMARSGAFAFPAPISEEAVHGKGSLALELEEEVALLLGTQLTSGDDSHRKLDAILVETGNGTLLSGVCIGFAGSGTQIFGAEQKCERYHRSRDSRRPNAGLPGNSMCVEGSISQLSTSSLPMAVFTSPGMLSTMFDVRHDLMEATTTFTTKELKTHLLSSCTAPLAIGLYDKEFESRVGESTSGQTSNIGVIVQTGHHDSYGNHGCFEMSA